MLSDLVLFLEYTRDLLVVSLSDSVCELLVELLDACVVLCT